MEEEFKSEELSREEIELFVTEIFQNGRSCQLYYPLQKDLKDKCISKIISDNENSVFIGINGEPISNNEIISLLFWSGVRYVEENPVFCEIQFDQQIAELSSKIGACVFKKCAGPDVVYAGYKCPLGLSCSSNQEDKRHSKIVDGEDVCFACGTQSWYQCL